MIISFHRVCRAGTLTVSKAGDVLTINGEAYDFSSLPNGATIPEGSIPCPWIKSLIFRRTRRLAFDVASHAAVFVEHLAGIAIGLAHTAASEGEQGHQHQIL